MYVKDFYRAGKVLYKASKSLVPNKEVYNLYKAGTEQVKDLYKTGKRLAQSRKRTCTELVKTCIKQVKVLHKVGRRPPQSR